MSKYFNKKNINKIKYICEYCNNYFYSNCRPFIKFELKPLKNYIKLTKILCDFDLNLEIFIQKKVMEFY